MAISLYKKLSNPLTTLEHQSSVIQAPTSLNQTKWESSSRGVVRLRVSVATSGDVREQPKVADGTSDLLQDVFGKDKNPSCLMYGVANLPLGVPVARELIFEVAG